MTAIAWVIAVPLLLVAGVVTVLLWPLWLAVAFIGVSIWSLDKVFRRR